MTTTTAAGSTTGRRPAWRTDAREAAAGWGLLVLGVLVGAAAVGGVVVLASTGALLPVSSDGPPQVEVVAAAALEQGLLTVTGAVTSVAMVVAGLGVLRSGKATAYRAVLRVGLLPTAVVAAAGGLWLIALALLAVTAAVETLLRDR